MIKALLILLSFQIFSVNRIREFEENEKEVLTQNKKILVLNAETRTIQSSVSSNKRKIKNYEKLIGDINQLIERLKDQLIEDRDRKKLIELKIVKLYESYLIDHSFLSGEEEEQRQIEIDQSLALVNEVNENKSFIENKIRKHKELLVQANIELREVRVIISSLIKQLDNQRQDLRAEKENKKKIIDRQKYLIGRIDVRRKEVLPKKKRIVFTQPVKTLVESQKVDNGVRFSSSSPDIIASEDGEIIYSDRLHSYGHVCIIKHANNLKSIYLGEFTLVREVGKKVYKGEKIAEFDDPSSQSVYFELRRGKSYIQDIEWNKASL